MSSFQLSEEMKRVGWRIGVGDSLRALGNSISVLMLQPSPQSPLFRLRIGLQVSILEIRKHDSRKRATRGRWQRLDSTYTPTNLKAWERLAQFWADYVKKFSAGNDNLWGWEEDLQKNHNLCHTQVNANYRAPSMRGGVGRGRKCKSLPDGKLVLGYRPVTGHKLGEKNNGK